MTKVRIKIAKNNILMHICITSFKTFVALRKDILRNIIKTSIFTKVLFIEKCFALKKLFQSLQQIK